MANTHTHTHPANSESVVTHTSGDDAGITQTATHVGTAKKIAVNTYRAAKMGHDVVQAPKKINTLKTETSNALAQRTKPKPQINQAPPSESPPPNESAPPGEHPVPNSVPEPAPSNSLPQPSVVEGEITPIVREASTLSQATRVGVAFAPAIFGGVSGAFKEIKHGGSTKQVLVATAYGTANGALGVDEWKTALGNNKKLTIVDRVLAGGRGATAVVATGAGVASFTPAAPVAAPIATGAGLANLGLGVLQDVAHWTGIANNKGTLETAYDGINEFNKTLEPIARADSALYRSLLPLQAVDHALYHGHLDELRGKISPAMGTALYRFNNINGQSPMLRVEEASDFSKQLAKELRAHDAGGDAIRKALGPALQKAGVTAEQYATGLDGYAHELDKVDDRMKHMNAGEYAQVVQGSADHLQAALNSRGPSNQQQPAPRQAPAQLQVANHGRPNRAALKQVDGTKDTTAPHSTPVHTIAVAQRRPAPSRSALHSATL